MTEVNGIGPCSSLAFVGGTDRNGGGGNRKWNISRKRPGKPRESTKNEGKGITEKICYPLEFPSN